MSSSFPKSHDSAPAASAAFDALEDNGLDGEYSMVAEYPEEVEYYALLGLSRSPPPTDAEIRSAYRTLTLSFHPDKHPPHLREMAEHHFALIQDAYETLIDPQKRAVYEILGAEGVRQEWGRGGSMGLGGEAQQQIGIKAMSPVEFRRWFLKTMKERERNAIDTMVSARGSITVGVNASDMISVNKEQGEVTFHIPSPKLSACGIEYRFKAAVPLPRFLRAVDQEESEKADKAADESEPNEEVETVDVTIVSSILGNLVHPIQKAKVDYADGAQEDREVRLPFILASNNLKVGASVSHDLTGVAGAKGIWRIHPFSLLKDSTVTAEALVLPVPTLNTHVSRAFQPVSGIKPFQVTASSSFLRSPLESPPSFTLQASKEIADRKLAFCTWSSGLVTWPDLLQRLPFVGMGFETAFLALNEMSGLQIGLISLPKHRSNVPQPHENDEEQNDEMHELSEKQREIDYAAEQWQAQIQASPESGAFSFTYSRNIFSGKPSNDPVRAEWSAEGYYPMPTMDEPRAVRLEISAAVGLDLSIAWSVMGVRRVGEFTRMGLGVGLADSGLVFTVSWRRLGQRITIPINICPANKANHDAAALTAIFSWMTYCAIEFGYIRPRDRKQRRQAAARRHHELKKLVPKRRAESMQAIELMADQVQRRQAREEAQDGLVITKAEYGYIPPTNKKPKNGFAEPRVADVTIPAASLVDRGQLVIPRDTIKFQLLGFYDPAPLLPKRLKIWYRFQGRDHFVEVGDQEGVACPMRTHLISP